MDLVNKLKIDINLLTDEQLRQEFISFVDAIIEDYIVNDNIHCFVFDSAEKKSGFIKFAEGFNKNNHEYNFIYILDYTFKQLKLVIRPIYQNSFYEKKFDESICITYGMDDASLIINKLYKDINDLVSELYIYVKNALTNPLVLAVKKRIYDGNKIKNLEKEEVEKLYNEGKYLYEEYAENYFDKLFIVSKNTNGEKLFVNDADTPFVLRNGIVIYDYHNPNKEYPAFATKLGNTDNMTLFNMYDDYYKISNKLVKKKN